MPPPTTPVVLDTNTVLDLWVFREPRLEPLRRAIEEGALDLRSRADCLEELRRVLASRHLAVEEAHQRTVFEGYVGRVKQVPPPASDAEPLPRCRDRDDQKFLEVARDAQARWLVTRDKALLGLADHRIIESRFRVLLPSRFAQLLAGEPD
ncbi:putative toxin-antitoxin system toxin component, PIN family [Myxococcaceae bacterium GXIMD 01537]